MTDKVVDASALAAIAFQEPGEDDVRAQLRKHHWRAPSILPYQMANVCRKKMRLSPDKRTLVFDQFIASLDVPIQLHDVTFGEVVELAILHNLSAYDASYLWLARNLDIELVTLDEKLQKAARAI